MSLPRLLTGVRPGAPGPPRYADHLAQHGPPGRTADLVDAVDRAGLRGRGGAAFPTAVKLRAVAATRAPRVVVVNGVESEPMSAKDRTLLRVAPHLVLDGALAAARAVDATNIVVAVGVRAGAGAGTGADAEAAHAALQHAVAERDLSDIVGVQRVPAVHLAGEETALIRALDGGPPLPTTVPPRPAQRGLGGRPTLVQNAETLAHLALVDRHGPDWFRGVGTDTQPGSVLVTVGGAVRRPGIVETACGTTVARVLEAAGGAVEPLHAVLVGGYHGVWVPAGEADALTLDDRGLARHGGGLGAGVIVALGHSACPVAELVATMGWLTGESARQCGPCLSALPAIAELLATVADGRADPQALERLTRWGRQLRGRGACHLPDGAVGFLASGLRVFAEQVADHERHGPCAACARPTTLRLPRTGQRVPA